ncbi:MAG TPA: carbonic anhydrase family protein [Gammaproteobacteria bacterium]|nr:carbonic anhydrase family protein [Gammaproteobacteria bacterium]
MLRRSPGFSVALIVIGTVLTPGFAALAAHGHWSYTGHTGPAYWGTLEQDYQTCALGRTQSPIDIRDAGVHKSDLPAIEFHYQPSKLKIIDNGHTVQVNYAPGSSISVGGKRYELQQFHFHKPSEEKLDGKSYDMVAHLVHKDADGKLAVVAVLLAKADAGNPLIKTLWDNLPSKKEVESAVDAVTIDATDLLPTNRSYYTFSGSLTTPPCSEGVTWFVLRSPTAISGDEVARFAKSYPLNARPAQPLNGREVKAGG